MPSDAKTLRRNLRSFGFTDAAISAAWPSWWSEEAESSMSANTELRFSLARKLGLDPRTLLADDEPRFVWYDETKFKRLSTEDEHERSAISAFGTSVSRAVISGTRPGPPIPDFSAIQLRESILKSQPFVRLVDLLGFCWAMGIPVIHLRVFPLSAKRMCAMAVRVAGRFAILLSKDAQYPAPAAYYVAHEIGHIALGHVSAAGAVVDLQDPLEGIKVTDPEEKEADAYALSLLTGSSQPEIKTEALRFTARMLASSLFETSKELRVEPGTLALCFGHSTGDWSKANAAMKLIYSKPRPVWAEVNKVADTQLSWPDISDDMAMFIRAIMGIPANGNFRRR